MTVGGIVTEAKRIRTRNGDHMMFATLDDLEGSVEMLVFGKALAEHEAALAVDRSCWCAVASTTRKPGKTCVVVQSVEAVRADRARRCERARARRAERGRAAATAQAQPVRLRVDATRSARER